MFYFFRHQFLRYHCENTRGFFVMWVVLHLNFEKRNNTMWCMYFQKIPKIEAKYVIVRQLFLGVCWKFAFLENINFHFSCQKIVVLIFLQHLSLHQDVFDVLCVFKKFFPSFSEHHIQFLGFHIFFWTSKTSQKGTFKICRITHNSLTHIFALSVQKISDPVVDIFSDFLWFLRN